MPVVTSVANVGIIVCSDVGVFNAAVPTDNISFSFNENRDSDYPCATNMEYWVK